MVTHDSLLLLQALGPLKEHPNERLADGLLADRPFQQAVERGRYGLTTAILALAPVEVPIARDVAKMPADRAVRELEALRGELFDQLRERCPATDAVALDLLAQGLGQPARKAAARLNFGSGDRISDFIHGRSILGRGSTTSSSITVSAGGNHRVRRQVSLPAGGFLHWDLTRGHASPSHTASPDKPRILLLSSTYLIEIESERRVCARGQVMLHQRTGGWCGSLWRDCHLTELSIVLWTTSACWASRSESLRPSLSWPAADSEPRCPNTTGV